MNLIYLTIYVIFGIGVTFFTIKLYVKNMTAISMSIKTVKELNFKMNMVVLNMLLSISNITCVLFYFKLITTHWIAFFTT
jgi:hypothetical protein